MSWLCSVKKEEVWLHLQWSEAWSPSLFTSSFWTLEFFDFQASVIISLWAFSCGNRGLIDRYQNPGKSRLSFTSFLAKINSIFIFMYLPKKRAPDWNACSSQITAESVSRPAAKGCQPECVQTGVIYWSADLLIYWSADPLICWSTNTEVKSGEILWKSSLSRFFSSLLSVESFGCLFFLHLKVFLSSFQTRCILI